MATVITDNIMGAMADITPTDPVGRSRPASAAAYLALGIGALLAVAGAARLWAAVLAEPARAGLETLSKTNAPPPPAQARQIADALAAAGRLAPVIVPWTASDRGASLEALLRAAAGDPSATAVQAAALAAAPGDPNGWLRLARQRAAAGDVTGAGQALRLSFLSGAVVPGLMLPRLRLGLDLNSALDAETQQLLARQIRLVWMLEPSALPPLLVNSAYRPILAAALAAVTPADEQQFRRVNRLDPRP